VRDDGCGGSNKLEISRELGYQVMDINIAGSVTGL